MHILLRALPLSVSFSDPRECLASCCPRAFTDGRALLPCHRPESRLPSLCPLQREWAGPQAVLSDTGAGLRYVGEISLLACILGVRALAGTEEASRCRGAPTGWCVCAGHLARAPGPRSRPGSRPVRTSCPEHPAEQTLTDTLATSLLPGLRPAARRSLPLERPRAQALRRAPSLSPGRQPQEGPPGEPPSPQRAPRPSGCSATPGPPVPESCSRASGPVRLATLPLQGVQPFP